MLWAFSRAAGGSHVANGDVPFFVKAAVSVVDVLANFLSVVHLENPSLFSTVFLSSICLFLFFKRFLFLLLARDVTSKALHYIGLCGKIKYHHHFDQTPGYCNSIVNMSIGAFTQY